MGSGGSRTAASDKDIEGNIQIGNAFCQFTTMGDVVFNGEVTSDQMAALAMINEILRRLRSGRLIQYDFDPLSLDNEERLVHCEWLPSGNLKMHKNKDGSLEVPTRKWHHAWTQAEAMSRPRGFTCLLSLAQTLPRRRIITKTFTPAEGIDNGDSQQVSEGAAERE